MFTTHTDESFIKNWNEMLPLWNIHYKELSEHYKKNIPLSPDYTRYLELEIQGKLLYITLREHGDLVGYFSGFLGTALHYNFCLSLALDLFYVLPTHRGTLDEQNGGILLLNAIKREAVRRGVVAWTMGRKSKRGKHMEKLLIDAGFEPFEIHYVCWLK